MVRNMSNEKKNINDVFGVVEEIIQEEDKKITPTSPFDFINSISHTKEDLMVDEWSEKNYPTFVVNKGLSFGADTVVQANEMNSRPHLDKKMQFEFLKSTIRPRKRFNKWIKADTNSDIEIIKEYYGYSNDKAKQVLPLLTKEQLEILKENMFRGGHSKH